MALYSLAGRAFVCGVLQHVFAAVPAARDEEGD
jgi:hypothetical protein